MSVDICKILFIMAMLGEPSKLTLAVSAGAVWVVSAVLAGCLAGASVLLQAVSRVAETATANRVR
ncbi:hypothetical protein [Moraxella lacunata]|uniref:hypothetical protein n=1 Tax=Moraxella lacunata TaxID=477 RepID=UPI003EE1098A